MNPLKLFLLFLLIYLLKVESRRQPTTNLNECPRFCKCFSTVVNCSKQNFNVIPHLPMWTEFLYINDNPLEAFAVHDSTSMIIPPNNLTEINLTRTNLFLVDPDVFSTLFNDVEYIQNSLVKLIFDENKLNKFPLMNNVINLRLLSLSNNNLNYESIENLNIFDAYPHLESLDLSYNQIKYIPKHFLCHSCHSNKIELTILNLNNNGIETIENDAFEFFGNLKQLKLAKNNIVFISKTWIGRSISLRELDLNYNQISKIGTLAFEGLSSLQVLKMKRNKLNNLDDGSFWGLEKLEKLQLDHNNISTISQGWTYGLKSLKELNLKHNSINKISINSWDSPRKLIEINLNFNKLQNIHKETFSKLSSLQTLKLANNNVEFVEENSFLSLKKLTNLDLSNNQLSWTIESSSNGLFFGLGQLKELRLDQNQIKLIYQHTFNGLMNLKKLNLTSNPISSIQNESFVWFESLNELHLENTDLLCDCTLKWFSQWLRQSNTRKKFATKIRCKHPHELAIKSSNSFLNIDQNEFKCQDFLKPYLIKDFNDITKPIAAIKNQNITFECKVASGSDDQVKFKWFKDNQIIDHDRAKLHTIAEIYSQNVTHYTNVFNLVDIQDEDQGKYYCMASNSYGSIYSSKFPVKVYVTPHFIKEPHNVTVKLGHTAKLECAAKGQPIPVISWQKDGGDNFPAAMERRMHVMPADDVFFIVEVKKSDMGSYNCYAANDAGSIVSTAYLNVIEMPSFVRKMNDKKASIGSTVSLECLAAGIPMPQIVWYKDGYLLKPTERHFFTAEGQMLIIVKLKLSDQGVYSCNISNPYGNVQDSSYLTIIKHNSEKKEDLLSSFVSVIRAHALTVLIIVLCVLFTSFAWILVIFHIQRKSFKNETDNTSNDDDFADPTLTRNDYKQTYQTDSLDFCSESSSASDTGIEESCQSYEEEHEIINGINHNREYHSLPRKSTFIHQNRVQPYQVAMNSRYHSSLPRKYITNYHQIDKNVQKLIKHNNNYKTYLQSSKEQKLLAKKQKHQQILNLRRTNNMTEHYHFETSFLPTNHNQPQMLRTFSINEINASNISY